MSLPFANDTFDVVQTSQVLCHTPDPVAVMNEMRRVCKPGGFVACVSRNLYLPSSTRA